MEKVDIYFIGKHNVMKAVLDSYHNNVKKAKLILDCGCGIGTYAYNLYEGSYIGLDIKANSVRLAHNVHPRHMFIANDATLLSFRNEVFDCVICSEVLEHIPNDKAVLAELSRVIKPSGKLIVSVPNAECQNVFVHLQRKLIDNEIGHVRIGYRLSDLSKLLVLYGFKIKKISYNCGPITAILETLVITFGRLFGYTPSSIGRLLKKSHFFLEIIFRIYRLLFLLVFYISRLDEVLPKHCRSNIVLLIEKC